MTALENGGRPDRRTERRSDARAYLRAVAIVSTLFGLYLILTPGSTFATSPAWRGALQLIPWGEPTVLGAVFVVCGPLASQAFHPGTRWRMVGLVALAVGATAWGLVAGSFVWAAVQAAGLGAGFAMLTAFVAWLHIRLARRR